MGSLDTFVGKYIRLTEDLHEMRSYLNDIRICFVALTVSCYVGILMYALILCLRRRGGNGHGGGGGGHGGGSSGSDDGRPPSRFRQSVINSQPRGRSHSRFGDGGGDAESGNGGTGVQTSEWDDMMPPPPNGSAVKTADGYRYRNPSRGGGQQKIPFPSQNRLSLAMDSLEPSLGGKRQQLVVDNHTGTVLSSSTNQLGGGGGGLYSPNSRRSPSENAFRDGFIEKSPSIT